MRNRLKKKTNRQSPGAAPPNLVDEIANSLLCDGRIEGLEQELEKLDWRVIMGRAAANGACRKTALAALPARC